MQKFGFIAQRILLHVPFYCFTNISIIIMGKVTSLYGKTMGKIGSIVFSTSGGQTIAREYNPHVANPNTSAQIDQRARMKLMSQISAALAPSLAYTKDGLVSARNKFVKRNFENSYALNGTAQVSYENLQLTEGNLGLPQIVAYAEAGQNGRSIIVAFTEEPSANISRIVYIIFSKTQEGKLSFISSNIVSVRAQSAIGFFQGTFTNVPNGDIVIYAYGMIDTSERASANYGNLNVVDGSDLAKLVATRAISFTDYQFTQTRGTTMGANNQPVTPTPSGSVRIYATALGEGGTVTGGGTYEVGTEVTLTATAAAQYQFRAWLKNGTTQVLSTSNPWTFNAENQVDAIASFDFVGNDTL